MWILQGAIALRCCNLQSQYSLACSHRATHSTTGQQIRCLIVKREYASLCFSPALSACRALRPGDYESLREAHIDMFPVDYEDAFFQRVVNGQDGLESLAAVCG